MTTVQTTIVVKLTMAQAAALVEALGDMQVEEIAQVYSKVLEALQEVEGDAT